MRPLLLVLSCLAVSANAAITISNVVDKTKYDAPRSYTVTADPNAATTTATLDGIASVVGAAVSVTAIGYHELRAESRTAGGTLVDTKFVRFITRDPSRGDTESGIPVFTPFRTVNDAPSAFAGKNLRVIAPAAWPVGLPIPVAVVLRDGADENVRLNGSVTFGGFPFSSLQMRRGWGSMLAPAAKAAGVLSVDARLNGLADNPAITIQSAPAFTAVSGSIAANTTWPANSRVHVTGTLTIEAGATLTVGAGTIVTVSTGDGTATSAAEIVVRGTLQVNGSRTSPVVFAPDTAGQSWGGIELPVATSVVSASNSIFYGSGEDATWFSTHSGYASHRPEQTLFLVAGSGSGTAVGAQLHLTECYCFSLTGQGMNGKTNTWVDIQRSLMQRAITCGELNGCKVTIDRSALIEFPSETAEFVDADNDALYMTGGDESITNTVIGFTKDDGIDTGGNGGDNPFTSGTDVTPFLSLNNWYEGAVHEGNSLSGTRNVTFTGCVFLNCGQGVEAGYSASATGDGPNAIVDGCLFVNNMVGVRWGDNYGSGYNYNPSMEVKNSLVLNSFYHDAFSGQWHPTQANAWIYQDATSTNTFGKPYFDVHNNYMSQSDAVHHPANVQWNPANPSHAFLLASFMPVPGSKVGVAVSSYSPAQNDIATYPGEFTVRLSTYSSLPVSVAWTVVGKSEPFADSETSLASGTVQFSPGETVKTISAPVANPSGFGVIRVVLSAPQNAEVTGEITYFRLPPTEVVARAGTGWRFRQTPSEPPSTWKQLGFDDSSASATEWLPATLPAGFGTFSGVTFGTTVASGPTGDRTRVFYFRRKFTVPSQSPIKTLTFRVRRDDGVIAWLNNGPTPIANSADGGVIPTPATYATLSPNATDTTTYFTFDVPISNLVSGQNILAVEVHQTSVTSSDLLMDCELIASFESPFALGLGKAAGEGFLYWSDPDATLEETVDFTAWAPLPGAASPFPITVSGLQKFYRLRK